VNAAIIKNDKELLKLANKTSDKKVKERKMKEALKA